MVVIHFGPSNIGTRFIGIESLFGEEFRQRGRPPKTVKESVIAEKMINMSGIEAPVPIAAMTATQSESLSLPVA